MDDSPSSSKLSTRGQPRKLVKTFSMSDSELSSGSSIFEESQNSDSTYRPYRKRGHEQRNDDFYKSGKWDGHELRTVPETESTVTTRRTTATLVSNGTTDPMANPNYHMRRENARADLKGRFEDSPDLIDTFFDFDAILQEMPSTDTFLAKNYSNGRWKNIHANETSESVLNKNFLGLLDGIQRHFFGGRHAQRRRFRATHSTPVAVNGQSNRFLQPDVFFCGQGRSLPGTSLESSPFLKIPQWMWLFVPLDGKIHRNRCKDDDHYQLASYVRETFSAQDNRQFIPGFIFTQLVLDFYLFDRSGFALRSSFDYHAEPEKFMAIIYSLLTFDEERLGFDSSIVHENGQQYITTCVRDATGSQRVQRYIVDEKLWHSTALVGDCTICWRVKKEGEDDGYYIIKDAWVVGGSGNEGSLLERVSSTELNGLIPIVSHEDVKIKRTDEVDCISNIRPRRTEGNTTTLENRVHTRIVMRLDGKARPLEFFKNPVELLIALHDAIEGHRNLYKHGILCRDVTPSNILIQPNAPKGRRGILFNLHCAVGTQSIPSVGSDDYIEHLLPASLPDTLGSRAFQSCRALAALADRARYSSKVMGKHHYTDDLESFYYVLRYLVTLLPAPGLLKSDPSHSEWFTKAGFGLKYGDWAKQTPQFTVTKRFGKPVRSLLEQFHPFLRPTASVVPPASWRPIGLRDYDTVLKLFRNAIEGFLGGETQDEFAQSEMTAVNPHKTTPIIPLAREADDLETLPEELQPKRQRNDSYGLSIADRIKCASTRRTRH